MSSTRQLRLCNRPGISMPGRQAMLIEAWARRLVGSPRRHRQSFNSARSVDSETRYPGGQRYRILRGAQRHLG